jgi:hypothetical protein
MTASEQTAYNVHLYREMRLFFPGIKAPSPEAAAHIAAAKTTDNAETIDDCEGENMAALVDVVGDTDLCESRIIDFQPQLVLKSAARLLDALQAIARDEHACTCHVRSWYGQGHDTQCPVRIAGDSVAQATRKPQDSLPPASRSTTNS